MVEKIIINPENVRGYGNIINPHSSEDYELYNSTIEETTDTIGGIVTTVYEMEMMETTITVALSLSSSTVTLGNSVTLTATVLDDETPVTGETVTFKAGSTTLGTGTTNSSGIATYSYTTNTAGTLSLTASYDRVTSTPVTLTVNKKTPTVTLTASSSTYILLQNIVLTATVKDGNTGISGVEVTCHHSGYSSGTQTATTNSSGVATFTYTGQGVGTHTFNCTTTADESYSSVTSSDVTVTMSKRPTSVSLSLSPSTIYVDGSSTATATLTQSSTPMSGATLTFKDGSTTLGTGTTNNNGVATYTISGLSSGSHSITATYDGNSTYDSSTSTAQTLTVQSHSYSVAFSQSSYTASGGEATLSLTLTDNSSPVSGATIAVTGSDSSSYSCITNSSGVGSVTVTNISAETTFTATYQSASDTCTVTVMTYLFYDECNSSAGLSNYGSSECVRGSNASITMTYDSTENAYKVSGSGNYHAFVPIPALDDEDEYTIEAEVKGQSIHYNMIGLFLDNRNNTTSYGLDYALNVYDKRLQSRQYKLSADGSEENVNIGSISANTWYKLAYTVNGSSLTGTLYDINGNQLGTKTRTLSVSNKRMGIFLFCENGSTNSTCYIRNIKAEYL